MNYSKKYLEILTNSGLIVEKNKTIFLTPKGVMTLRLLRRLDELRREESALMNQINGLLPLREKFEESIFDNIKELLAENGIIYKAVGNSILVGDLEICDEEKCRKGNLFSSTPRLIIGKRLSVYSNGREIIIVENRNIKSILEKNFKFRQGVGIIRVSGLILG
ncbi:winged helix-turn-helix domain-containing protein [Metallosphaera hakonensis]|uniref:winged helix-turn-helix domain-containing protein n=1 Tax=Metallosphaera hakonensis TaxID=79601 RepID=UPI0006D0CA8B|nr:winged helix-turn-helix domain-containing protein [Metallosphaera hakonensis]